MRTMLRGKVTLLFMMLGLLLAVPAIAFADVLQGDDLEAGANATKAPNDTGTAKFYLVANGSDGCNVDATHPATVTVSSDQSWLTIDSPGTAQLTACGTTNAATIGYSVSSTAPDGGVATVSGVASGGKSGNNGYNNNPGKFTVTVAVPTPSDTTPPDISYVLNPASPNGNNGWYNSGNVSLTWTVTENESAASLVKTGCVDQNITADQAATTYSCSATSDGGSAGPVDVTIKRDATAPTDVAFVGGPDANGSYDPDSVPDAPICTANGAISGLASCNVTGYSANAGSHTMTATATDNAGNAATATRSYSVLGWDLKGFYQPVDMGMTNTAKAGQTVPLKFEMFEKVSGDERTNVSDVKTFTQKVTCGSFEPSEDAIEQYSSGGTSLRYDTTGGQFIFNWQTPKSAGSCFKVTMTPNDTSSNALEAHIKLK